MIWSSVLDKFSFLVESMGILLKTFSERFLLDCVVSQVNLQPLSLELSKPKTNAEN